MTRDSQSHTHSQPHSLHLVGFWHSFTEILTEKVQNFTPSSMIILAFGEFCCYCNFDYSYPMSMTILAFTAVQWVQVCKWTSYFETQEVSSSGSTPWARFPDSSDRLIATTVWNRRGVHLEGEGSAGWQPGPRVTLTDLWSCASTMETLGLSGLGLKSQAARSPRLPGLIRVRHSHRDWKWNITHLVLAWSTQAIPWAMSLSLALPINKSSLTRQMQFPQRKKGVVTQIFLVGPSTLWIVCQMSHTVCNTSTQ